jgi:hypothetical protein
MSKIFIAAGHGGNDVGAVSNVYERDIAISVVDKAKEIIEKTGQNLGKTLAIVPHNLALRDEVAWINSNLQDEFKDVAINVHLNSNSGTPGTGTETWYGLKDLAIEVNEEVVKVLGLKNRGIKFSDQLYFNNVVKCGSVILELGFINNENDRRVVTELGGLALAKAIVRASNGTWRDAVVNPPIVPTPVPEQLYKVYDNYGIQQGAYKVLANAQNKLESLGYGSYIKDPSGNIIAAKVEPPKPIETPEEPKIEEVVQPIENEEKEPQNDSTQEIGAIVVLFDAIKKIIKLISELFAKLRG